MGTEIDVLREQQVDGGLIADLEAFRKRYEVEESQKKRLAAPSIPFYGKEILEQAIAALCREKIFFFPARRRLEKMCWPRIWPVCSGGRLQYFFPCEHGQQLADRNRYVCQ